MTTTQTTSTLTLGRLASADWRLTNGDLEGMDAGELLEHGARHLAAHGPSEYVGAVVGRIWSRLEGTKSPGVILTDITECAELLS